MMRWMGTVFAGLLGLAFGSFLNVCLSRWPEEESVVHPRSHCRACGRTLEWWENLPLVSWLALRGRCKGCGAWIGVRYPLVELAVGALWAAAAWVKLAPANAFDPPSALAIADAGLLMFFFWLLVALAALDMEHLWLPDWLTWPGILIGFLQGNLHGLLDASQVRIAMAVILEAMRSALVIVAAAGLILLLRWAYWLVRRQEGLGMGDAKLMAMLAAWLGVRGALLAFLLGVVLGAVVAVGMLLAPKRDGETWAVTRLPLGTFLCVGGIVSSLWGREILGAYLRLAGF